MNWEKARVAISIIGEDCRNLGLTVALASVGKIQKLFSSSRSLEEFRRLTSELQERILDETAAPRFFSLTDEEARHYNSPTDGWTEVLSRFPDATADVEDMNKCFALSRYAAAVFHSVQTIECGLIELGKFLNVNDPKSGWTAVTGKLASLVVKTKYPDLDAIHQKHFAFLEQMHGVVAALNNAWRNKISHAQGRLVLMTSEFSPEVAEEIMIASRSFMRRLATELPI